MNLSDISNGLSGVVSPERLAELKQIAAEAIGAFMKTNPSNEELLSLPERIMELCPKYDIHGMEATLFLSLALEEGERIMEEEINDEKSYLDRLQPTVDAAIEALKPVHAQEDKHIEIECAGVFGAAYALKPTRRVMVAEYFTADEVKPFVLTLLKTSDKREQEELDWLKDNDEWSLSITGVCYLDDSYEFMCEVLTNETQEAPNSVQFFMRAHDSDSPLGSTLRIRDRAVVARCLQDADLRRRCVLYALIASAGQNGGLEENHGKHLEKLEKKMLERFNGEAALVSYELARNRIYDNAPAEVIQELNERINRTKEELADSPTFNSTVSDLYRAFQAINNGLDPSDFMPPSETRH